MERLLRNYLDNLERRKERRELLTAGRGGGFEMQIRGGGTHGSPVERMAYLLCGDKELERLEKEIAPVDRFLSKCSDRDYLIFKLRYLQKKPWAEVAAVLGVSPAYARAGLRDDFLNRFKIFVNK